MDFTYHAYQQLISLLKQNGYSFSDYHAHSRYSRCVILRHDIDNSISKALDLAELECSQNVSSTFFVLLRTDFYNPASKQNVEYLKRIISLGHEVGLHFDEMAYDELDDVPCAIKKEADILADIIGRPVTTVSMHRPSPMTLDANYEIPGMVNSYGKTFFQDFKYLSDSRRRWREPVLDIIQSQQYDRLHILTHPIWYHEQEESIHDTIRTFIRSANKERYYQEADNIKDIDSIVSISEIE